MHLLCQVGGGLGVGGWGLGRGWGRVLKPGGGWVCVQISGVVIDQNRFVEWCRAVGDKSTKREEVGEMGWDGMG